MATSRPATTTIRAAVLPLYARPVLKSADPNADVPFVNSALLAKTVQDSVGGWFGVSGGAVVIGLIVIVLIAAKAADDKRPKPAVLSAVCAQDAHHTCPGRVKVVIGKTETVESCSCTCHGTASTHCAGSRHDLCDGSVWQASGTHKVCRCTCHLRTA